MNSPKNLSPNPRRVAYEALSAVETGTNPDEAINSLSLLLSPKDLALAGALLHEALRNRAYLDWLAAGKLRSPKVSKSLANILRLGLAQILYFDRLGEHAIVMETVDLAKIFAPGRQGLVNALLRGFLRDKENGRFPPPLPQNWEELKSLSVLYSYPQWLAEKIVKRFGREKGAEILKAGNVPTPPTLRINPRKMDRGEFLAQFPLGGLPCSLSPWGVKLENFAGRPDSWPGYKEGLFSLQDEASQLLGLFLNGFNGKKILDACAGLGGKSLSAASLLPRSQVLALDKDGPKLAALEKEAHRLGLGNIETKSVDFLKFSSQEKFDLVIVDAPCSGLGVIRRRPDMKWNKKPGDPAQLAVTQLKLLEKAVDFLAPQGLLIYGVCTFTSEEGPLVAQKFMASKPPLRLLAKDLWPGPLRPLLSTEGHLTLTPPLCDGFFWAAFQKPQ